MEIPAIRGCRHFFGLILAFSALGPFLLAAANGKDIYLAVRQDGHRGSGSAQDPFDASTPDKYDQLLATYSQNTVFHYAAGTYQTRGWHYRTRKSAGTNCKHYGSGMDQTVIRLVGANDLTQDGVIFGSDYDATADGFEVQSLTLDCNASGNPRFTNGLGATAAISTNGSNILIRGIKVIGFGTSRVGVECFVVFIYPGPALNWRSFNNVILDHCVFTGPAQGNKDGLSCVVIGAAPSARIEGAIVNCRFVNLKSDFSYSHALRAPLCEGNEVTGCDNGFYLEPDDRQAGTWVIRKNRFHDVTTAVMVKWHPTGSLNTIQFEDNDVVLKADPQQTPVAFAVDDTGLKPGDQKPTIAKVILRNNRIRVAEMSKEQVARAAGLVLISSEATYSVGDLVLENNLFSLPAGREMIISPSPVVRRFIQRGNVDSSQGEVRVRDVHGNPVNPL
ncbi:MAG TPA: hypothetical protein VK673_16270 [Chthoniobacterales bacterium]|nr:hypothetical protein [Chthoniobacterales bacterium]